MLQVETPPPRVRSESLYSAPVRFNGGGDEAHEVSSIGTFETSASGPITSARWDDNARECSICGLQLGKARFRPRHHCRVCGRCVCAGCSPSQVQLPTHEGLQRVCSPCIAIAAQAPKLRSRMTQLCARLMSIGGGQGLVAEEQGKGLWSVLLDCEQSCDDLESLRANYETAKSTADRANQQAERERRRAEDLEGQVRPAIENLGGLKSRLEKLAAGSPRKRRVEAASSDESPGHPAVAPGARTPRTRTPPGRALTDAVSQVTAQVEALEAKPSQHVRRLGSWTPASSIHSPSGDPALATVLTGVKVSKELWEPNRAECGICGRGIGWRKMRPRHHCRVCGRCTCHECSRGMLPIPGAPGLHRCCTPCTEPLSQWQSVRDRLQQLCQRLKLRLVEGAELPSLEDEVAGTGVLELLARCEEVLGQNRSQAPAPPQPTFGVAS